MIGVLLINLGTPDAPTTRAVRCYLRQFLMDPYVIDIHPLARWFLVNLMIAPFRAPKSARAYQSIWTDAGSPLLVHTRALAKALQARLGEGFQVRMGMRYGNPSLETALKEFSLNGVSEIRVLPRYPQYAESSTETALQEVGRVTRLLPGLPPLRFLSSFYGDPAFIRAFAELGREHFTSFKPDHVLFSFHGLPKRHLIKLHPDYCFLRSDCCERIGTKNRNCYRAQCFFTASRIIQDLGLNAADTTVSFQSRLGRTPWIEPFTDQLLPQLARKGVKRLAVFCPSFIADCLETLEEIGIRGKKQFVESGGQDLLLIPSLNSRPDWVAALTRLLCQ